VIVVNDASTDETREVVKEFGTEVKLVNHAYNLGYGKSIKRGMGLAETEWVATFDADGQHRVEDLEKLAALAEDNDAVVGRRERSSSVRLSRVPGKWVLGKVVNLLVGQNIPDINCGLRLFRRKVILSILNLTSDRFSFSTSSLVALLKAGYQVLFVPVIIDPRIGKSTVRQIRDGFQTIMLILRLVTLFDPFRIMLPFGAALVLVGIIYQVTSIIYFGWDINKLTLLLGISGLVIFMMALIADQISALRRELTIVYPPEQSCQHLDESIDGSD
jgi:glycosyltransferase involved in cell wall biosynthesis